MHHLSAEAFVDLLDGTVADASVPHLQRCDRCRTQLAQLRETARTAMQADVPEPSPLFWDHLSARVRDAVREEAVTAPHGAGISERFRALRISWWSVGGLVSAVGAAALVVMLQMPRVGAPLPQEQIGFDSVAQAPVEGSEPANTTEPDVTLGFVTDLASGVDWDSAAGFGPSPGEVDRSVANLNDGERVELQRLLNDALGGGA